ncbi:MAG: polysaccharide deacetylase family protein [Opitutus sp.]
MARVLLYSEVIGKIVAVLLWYFTSWTALGAVLFFGPDFFVLYHLFAPSGQWICPSLTRFKANGNEVWLTIDDGPDGEDTLRILNLLDRHAARATFFVVGDRAAKRPDLIAEIVRRGHEIGHHTHTHPAGTLWCASPARLARELDSALAVLRTAGARPGRFRAPVGIKNVFLAGALAARNMECIGWTVRSGDWLAKRPEVVQQNVMRQMRPGAIILMHEGPSVPRPVRVEAISLVLESLTTRGFRCVIPAFAQGSAVVEDQSRAPLAPAPVHSPNPAASLN